MDAKIYDLEDRTLNFGKGILSLVQRIPENSVTRPLISQVIRSATSVGANYVEANNADSRKDFVYKIVIVKKRSG